MSATPGPWCVKRQGVVADRANGNVIATLGYNVVVGGTEDDDNARLIAAAPRLADALLGLLVALGKHSMKFDADALADICPACDEASAALIESGRVMG